jgi:endonuclease/exonuclease/phosphatase family metal-dependent hydrolase
MTKEVIVAGDFNAQIAGQGHSFSNANGDLCLELMRVTNIGLIPQVHPTFIREQTALAEERRSTIDHFIVSRNILNSYNSCETKNDFTGSDHDIVELRFGLVVPESKPNPGRNCRKLTFDKTNKLY